MGEAVKVIDMTGPKVRVLGSYQEMHHQHSRPDVLPAPTERAKEFLPELQENLKLLVEQTEQDILQNDKRFAFVRHCREKHSSDSDPPTC